MDQGQRMIVSQEQMNTAIRSPNHLREWLVESGRKWIVFNGEELVDALPFPDGHEALIQLIMAYRDHRMTIPSGQYDTDTSPDGAKLRIPRMKDEQLTLPELDRCIRSLVGMATDMDSNWSLNNPEL